MELKNGLQENSTVMLDNLDKHKRKNQRRNGPKKGSGRSRISHGEANTRDMSTYYLANFLLTTA